MLGSGRRGGGEAVKTRTANGLNLGGCVEAFTWSY